MKHILILLCAIAMIMATTTGCNVPADKEIDKGNQVHDLPPLAIITDANMNPAVNIDFSILLEANYPAVEWSVVESSLPEGISFDSKEGLLYGIPTTMDSEGSILIEASNGNEVVSKRFNITVVDNNWMTPTNVNVSNFYPGARAEETVRIHNDYSLVGERKIVTTEESDIPDKHGFITVDIPVNQTLHDGDTSNILCISSNLPSDSLAVVGYDLTENTITISGFTPLSERTIEIIYVADAIFSIYCKTIDLDIEAYITITPNTLLLAPHETGEVLVVIEFPEDLEIEVEQFSFHISAGKITTMTHTLTVITEMNTLWTVYMR